MSFTFHSTYMVPYLLSFRFYLEPMVFYLGGGAGRGCSFHSSGFVPSILVVAFSILWGCPLHAWVGGTSFFIFLRRCGSPRIAESDPVPCLPPPLHPQEWRGRRPQVWIERPRPSKKVEGDDPPRMEWATPQREQSPRMEDTTSQKCGGRTTVILPVKELINVQTHVK